MAWNLFQRANVAWLDAWRFVQLLTIFTTPKPFDGKIAVIQRNAIRSWTLLRPACEVILMGDERGIAEAAAGLGVRHERDVGRNEFGTPLASAAFLLAESVATNHLLCYANADIIFLDDFMPAVVGCFRDKPRAMLVGRRRDTPIERSLDFRSGWEEDIRRIVGASGRLREADAIDYFVFPRGVLGELPPFAIGRPGWDNWLLYRARALGCQLIDGTATVTAVHQNHDYGHHPQGWHGVWEGPEASRNVMLAGGRERCFTIDDATHELAGGRVRWRGLRGLRRRFASRAVLLPAIAPLARSIVWLADRSHAARRIFGLTASGTKASR